MLALTLISPCFQSTVTSVSTSDGELRVSHKVGAVVVAVVCYCCCVVADPVSAAGALLQHCRPGLAQPGGGCSDGGDCRGRGGGLQTAAALQPPHGGAHVSGHGDTCCRDHGPGGARQDGRECDQ